MGAVTTCFCSVSELNETFFFAQFKLLFVNNFPEDPLDLILLGLLKEFVICQRLSDSILIIKSLLEIRPLNCHFSPKLFIGRILSRFDSYFGIS